MAETVAGLQQRRESVEELYALIESLGRRPRWASPRPDGYNRIVCAEGPIRSVDFMATTRYVNPFSETDDDVQDHCAILFNVVPGYGRSPGLDGFAIGSGQASVLAPEYGVRWYGNDMGLGVLDRLNADTKLARSLARMPELSVSVERAGQAEEVYAGATGAFAHTSMFMRAWKWRSTGNIHSVADHFMIISYGWTGPEYEPKDRGRQDPWAGHLPSPEAWAALEAVAAHLVAVEASPRDSDGRGHATRAVTESSYVPDGGVASSQLAQFVGMWVITIATLALMVLWLVSLPLALAGRRLHLIERLYGKRTVEGQLGRKWAKTSPGDLRGIGGQRWIRVDTLPFKVPAQIHETLREGEKVEVTYWARSAEVISITRWGERIG